MPAVNLAFFTPDTDECRQGGNTTTDSWRRAYIVALRSQATVQAERELGFTHSHNDDAAVLVRVDGLLVANGEAGEHRTGDG